MFVKKISGALGIVLAGLIASWALGVGAIGVCLVGSWFSGRPVPDFINNQAIWGALGLISISLMVPHLILWVSKAISSRVFAGVAIAAVAAIHIYFGLLESTQWNQESGKEIHQLRDLLMCSEQTVADRTVEVGRNMGLYNGLFAVLLIGSLFLRRLDAFRVRAALLSLIVAAGIIGTWTIGSPKIVIVQSLPAALALTALILGRPGTLDERAATARIIEIEKQLLELKMRDGQTVFRGQHPKTAGFLVADLVVNEGLDPDLSFGIFKEPGRKFEAILRASNARNLEDAKRGGHGLAMKLSGVEGARLMPDDAESDVQDFLLFDHANFFMGDAFEYVDFEWAELWASDAAGVVSKLKLLLAFPNLLSLFTLTQKIQKSPSANPLGRPYWSVVPYRLGPHAVKFRVRPLTPGAPAIEGDSDNSVNVAILKSLNSPPEGGWKLSFEAQIQVDPDRMPIEDATVLWSEKLAPFVPLATITIDPARSKARFGDDLGVNIPAPPRGHGKPGEDLSMNPWRGLVEHEPLGGINRVRRQVYLELSALRRQWNSK